MSKGELIIIFVIIYCCNANISLEELKIATNQIAKQLTTLVESNTKCREIELKYKKYEMESVVDIEVADVSKEFNKKLEILLKSFMTSVRNIKTKAENFHDEYVYNENIYVPQYYHEESDTLPTQMEVLAPKFSSKRTVNLNHSYIHTPVNVYNHHKDVLNDVAWSNQLDDIFKSNLETNANLLWQFYGSETGMHRLYPGTR